MGFLRAMAVGAVLQIDTKRSTAGVKALSYAVRTVENQFSKTDVILRGFARSMGIVAAGATAVSGAMAFGFSEAAKFENAMKAVEAVGGGTAQELAQLRDIALNLGGAFAPAEIAKAMEDMRRAGFTTQETMRDIGAVSNMAAAENIDLSKAMDIAVGTFRGVSEEGLTMARMVDMIAQASAASNASILDLGEALEYSTQVSRDLEAPFSELLTLLSAVGDVNIKGSIAGRNMATGFRRMTTALTGAGLPKARKVLDKLGISFVDTADGGTDLMATVDLIGKKMGNLDKKSKAAAITTIFGQDASKVFSALIARVNDANRPLSELHREIEESDNAAKRMADTRLDSFLGQLRLLKNELITLSIVATDDFLQPFAFGLKETRGILKEIRDGVEGVGGTFFNNVGRGMTNAVSDLIRVMLILNDELGTFAEEKLKNIEISAQTAGYSIGYLTVALMALMVVVAPLAFGLATLLLFMSGLGELGVVLAAVFGVGLWAAVSLLTGAFIMWQASGLGLKEALMGFGTFVIGLFTQFKNGFLETASASKNSLQPAIESLSFSWDQVKESFKFALENTISMIPSVVNVLGKLAGAFVYVLALGLRFGAFLLQITAVLLRVFITIASVILTIGLGIFVFLGDAFTLLFTKIQTLIENVLGFPLVVWGLEMLGFDMTEPIVEWEPEVDTGELWAEQLAKGVTDAIADAKAEAQQPPEVHNAVTIDDKRCVDVTAKVNLDGREIGKSVKKQDAELTERAGAGVEPWQRRQILAHGATVLGG